MICSPPKEWLHAPFVGGFEERRSINIGVCIARGAKGASIGMRGANAVGVTPSDNRLGRSWRLLGIPLGVYTVWDLAARPR